MSGDLDSAAAALRHLDPVIGTVAAATTLDMGRAAEARIRARARRHRRTGGMDRRLRLTTTGHGIGQRVTVHAGGKVAHLIVGGTRRHRITAHGRPLPIGGAGVRRFAESVQHPGTRPDPFVARGYADARGEIRSELAGAAQDLARAAARAVEG